MSRSIIYVAIGIAFGAVTNGCAWVVLARMKSLGQDVGVWRWAQKDLVLYKDYWKMAKKQNWSRAPVAIGIVSLTLAAFFLIFGVVVSH